MMERLQYPLSHEWHAAVSQHQDEQRKAGRSWGDARFMYDAKTMADEVPRLAGPGGIVAWPLRFPFVCI